MAEQKKGIKWYASQNQPSSQKTYHLSSCLFAYAFIWSLNLMQRQTRFHMPGLFWTFAFIFLFLCLAWNYITVTSSSGPKETQYWLAYSTSYPSPHPNPNIKELDYSILQLRTTHICNNSLAEIDWDRPFTIQITLLRQTSYFWPIMAHLIMNLPKYFWVLSSNQFSFSEKWT